MTEPLYDDSLSIPSSLFEDDTTFLGCDAGCTLSKIFVGKREDGVINFACRTYKNADIDVALDWMAANADINANSQMKITGVEGEPLKSKIANRLKCRVLFVNEFEAQQRGADLLLRRAPNADVFFPDPKLLFEADFDADKASDTWSEQDQRMIDNESVFPTLFASIGSASLMTWISEENEMLITGNCFIGGKAFLGLASFLLDTTDFKEIDALALRGDRRSADLIGRDVLKENVNPSYAAFPKELTIFTFGKVADGLTSSQNISREDRAASLLAFFGELILSFIYAKVADSKGGKRIVIGGNMARSQYFREYCFSRHQATALFHGGRELKFLKTGHATALGCLVVDTETS